MEPSVLYPLLFLAGLAAGTVDTIAGGGGLITIPVLLATGMPPPMALGTNKFQSSFGSGSATLHFIRARMVPLRSCVAGVAWTAVGAAAGAVAVQHADPGFLRMLIPFMLVAIAVYFIVTPQLGIDDIHPRMGAGPFHLLFGLGIGFYDGFFGPGTGSFWALAYVTALGFNLQRATAHTKVMNFTSNIASLAMFVIGGHVLYGPGLAMAAGQALGGRIGAQLVMRKGARFVRPLFIAAALAITARLIWQNLR